VLWRLAARTAAPIQYHDWSCAVTRCRDFIARLQLRRLDAARISCERIAPRLRFSLRWLGYLTLDRQSARSR